MRRILKLLATALTAAASLPLIAEAQTIVPIELVLAVDASSSVNQYEFELQMRGIAAAFRSPEVTQLIVSSGGLAATLIQWSTRADLHGAIPWRLLNDQSSIMSFASQVENTSRAPVGSLTGISNAISASVSAIVENRFVGRQAKIDISGDGINNTGVPLETARALARLNGITVNALAIETDVPALSRYFRRHVIVGTGAFVFRASNYSDFAQAMKAKLLRELSPATSRSRPVQSRHAAKSSR